MGGYFNKRSIVVYKDSSFEGKNMREMKNNERTNDSFVRFRFVNEKYRDREFIRFYRKTLPANVRVTNDASDLRKSILAPNRPQKNLWKIPAELPTR